ncbi:hypothetical protein A9Q81_23450 [Gammaproteobacteria bacterium 42_54_T18]|nr:hypothetical protein A9Q81_23450 [Gammaproteobacteria bacterium 42_54_T18]
MNTPKTKRTLPAAVATLIIATAGCSLHKPNTPSATIEPKDGPPKNFQDISQIPDAVPKIEPRARYGNHSPYEVLGKTYRVMKSAIGYKQDGIGSWYGEKFAGRKTSSFEPYDPYAMTAAHKSLPLPTYVRVTNLENNREIVVKVNDRGPFHEDRIIDLSYAAAAKLGYMDKGTARVRVEFINPSEIPRPTETQQAAPITQQNSNAVTLPIKPPLMEAQVLSTPSLATPSNDENMPIDTVNASLVNAHTQQTPTEHHIYLQVAAFSQLTTAQELERKLNSTIKAPTSINSTSSGFGENNTQIHRVRIGPFKDELSAILVSEQIKQQKMGDPLIIHR